VPNSVSIIINNYNYARFLRECIDSALNQSHRAQVIVVDDGSTDESIEVVQSYGSRICTILKDNGGQGSAVNAGFAAATGDVVMILDSDDLLELNAVEEVLLQWRAGTVMAHYAMTIIDTEGYPISTHPDPPECLDEGDVVPILLKSGRFRSTVTSGMAFGRDALARCLPVPESQYRESVDGYLLRCVAFLGKVQRIDGRLARYRVHGSNVSNVAVDPDGVANSCRKRIAIRRNEFALVREQSERHNRPRPNSSLGEDDPHYLALRLFSCILAPDQHPIPEDRRLALLLRYIEATLRGGAAWPTRAVCIALACAATVAPARHATKLVVWHVDPHQRPKYLRSLARVVRRDRARTLMPI
jgi:glycosyltransferase involved in cell wall biosynthesis